MERDSGGSVTDAGDEIGRLQAELCKAEERLQLWKEKTQIGVNELRSRILQLTKELTESQNLVMCLEKELQTLRQENAGCAAVAVAASPSSSIPGCVVHLMSQWASASIGVLSSTLLEKSTLALHVAATAWQEFDKYKRRTVQTLRLQTKNFDALELQISNLREQLSAAVEELKERNHAVESRDEALTVLQNRLDELEAANARLESSRATLNGNPNAEQLDAFETRLEEEREFMQREFASREHIIFEQHRDEMERLIAKHEKTVSELHAELEEVALAAAKAAVTAGMGVRGGASPGETNDAAYAELLSDFEALQVDLTAVRKERNDLLHELHRIKEKLEPKNGKTLGNDLTAVERCEPRTLPEALARVAELEEGTTRLSKELYETKKQLIATRYNPHGRERDTSQVLEGQQLSYLKFVVVKLLCANGDDNVAMNLLPVLSTVLQFNPTQLQEIYSSNPAWVKRRH